VFVKGHSGHHQSDAGELGGARELGEHDDPDDRRGRGEEADHQRVGRARELAHRELVGDVGDH
jgi:hypothetical protein